MSEGLATPDKRGPGRPPKRTALRERLRSKAPQKLDGIEGSRFAIPGAEQHEGVSLQWKRYSVQGQQDPYHIAAHRRNGWEPMQAEDFPELAARDDQGNVIPGPIIKDGMMLMGRPQELTDQAEARLAAKAAKQIHDQKVQIGLAPAGTLPRVGQDMRGQRMGIQTEAMRQVVED